MRKLHLFGVQPMSCYGVLRSIGGGCGRGEVGLVVYKRCIEGPDMFAGCGNFPHLKGGIRHLNEKWGATIRD